MGKKISLSEQRRRYAQLYARVPAIDCKGNCRDTCTEFPTPRAERRLVKVATGKELYADPVPYEVQERLGAGGRRERLVRRSCPLLSDAGQCEAYEVRPLICRLWGVTETMPCNYGCRPAGGKPLLTVRESYELIAEAYEISGDVKMASHYRQIRQVSDEHLDALAPTIRAMAQKQISLDEATRRGAEVREALGEPALHRKPQR